MKSIARKVPGTYPCDCRTLLTVGKTNEKNIFQDFGRFRMDSYVIFYKALSEKEIINIFGKGKFYCASGLGCDERFDDLIIVPYMFR